MSRILSIALIIMLLAGCASNRGPNLQMNLTREGWMHKLDSNPNAWLSGADRWFTASQPNTTELMNRRSPYSDAISSVSVKAPTFTNLRISGDFQVQIIGIYGPNKVYLYGPNAAIQQITVQVQGNTLCITQNKNASPVVRRVIVRIGMSNLRELRHTGCGTVEGIHLQSPCLSIVSSAVGGTYLAGDLNVTRITSTGPGPVVVLGANTSCLEICTTNNAVVDVSGRVGIRIIRLHDNSRINVIGATTSGGMKIYADGTGKIGLNGSNINIRELHASGSVQVYANSLYSTHMYAYLDGAPCVGMAGMACDLYLDTKHSSLFMGRYLCSQNAYVRARDTSHINIAASQRIFAAATNNASIYYFGTPNMMSQFVSGNGVVIPIWNSTTANSCMWRPAVSYKGEELVVRPRAY